MPKEANYVLKEVYMRIYEDYRGTDPCPTEYYARVAYLTPKRHLSSQIQLRLPNSWRCAKRVNSKSSQHF